MGDSRLVNYVSSLKSRGVKKAEALKYLERYGYTPSEVKYAVRQVYGGNGNSIFILLLLIGLAGAGVWWWTSSTESTIQPEIIPSTISLSIETPDLSKEIISGEQLIITANIGVPKETTITASITIKDSDSKTVYTDSSEKTVQGNIKKRFMIPTTELDGTYTGRIEVSGDKTTTRKDFTFNVFQNKKTDTDYDYGRTQTIPDQTTQTTTGTLTCNSCISTSACTTASCIDGRCVTSKTSLCCGNLECEDGETSKTCPQDCAVKKGTRTDKDIVSDAIQYATTDIQRSKSLCASLAETRRDTCLSEIAKKSGQDDICNLINSDDEQGACYISIVLEFQKSDTCQKIRDIERRDQCTNLANLLTLQQSMSTIPTNSSTST